MREYITHDLIIGLGNEMPEDASINMLVFRARGTTLVIARGPMDPHKTLAETSAHQLSELRKKVTAFKCTKPAEVRVGVDGNIAAMEVQAQFSQGNTLSCQYQLACELPGEPRLLALTYSKGSALTEADFDHWETLKQSLRFA
ncbi:DcrB-related protein [Pseudomonas paralactis]|uniref:DcrB-related protein n=1 Tax=Pseudomonas paralactis TaxID=1615673 RepID=UPI0034D60C64